MNILSVDQIYKADKITIKNQNIDSVQLMERAGEQVFDWIEDILMGAPIHIHVFCGIGNNGGDGLVVGRLLIESDYNVTVYVVNFSDKRSKDFLHNYDRIKTDTKVWPTLIKSEKDFPEIGSGDIVLDSIFGIGLNRSPEGWVKKLIEHLNKSGALIISIDIPSGLFANKALEDKDAVIKATHTLTFQIPKLAFFLPETGPFASMVKTLDIGLDQKFIEEAEPLAQLISQEEAQSFYIPRKKFGYKGTYGHALIVAGSYGKIGAAVLASTAAFRIGAGMVTAFVPKCGYNILQTTLPEAMVITDKEEEFITEITSDFEPTAIGIGMGMGKNQATVQALKKLFKNSKSQFVIDADALNNISENKDLMKLLPKKSILTPHPGELKRLIGSWNDDYEKLEKVKKFSKKHDVVVIVKGAYTATVYEDKIYINTSGNPGMGTAGSGDTLSGILTGLLCQGYDILSASLFGVFMHGFAGNKAADKMGYEALIAGDIIENLSEAYVELFMDPENDNWEDDDLFDDDWDDDDWDDDEWEDDFLK
ncbi:NAD(P)H-hydrate dehydratase [Aequorivita sp. H23M31]|uniref:Bifunctional NAD(P)H-hydrate repair enzyme n=1 Tax=Aequorivita ciconiae TaxID=2494375 RepID=A0A410G1D1_9FLAO|nr:NAD(P)H-hydrate dehydratase [Aequorivita sp. H23M31]QAA81084.1 NAD(P)H-hydrate dehydratase [Aequorivita sp. H23M31]